VTFVDLPEPFDLLNGSSKWVGEPVEVTEASGSAGSEPGPTFWVAGLQCDPVDVDWSLYDAVHVRDAVIVPDGLYDLDFVETGGACADADPLYSDILTIATSAWGDLTDGCPDACGSPDGVVDFIDISEAVDKFMNRPDTLSKSRVDVAPATVDLVVDFVDISWIVEAFRGSPFPYAGPGTSDPCP
jgi:hypothetical protein